MSEQKPLKNRTPMPDISGMSDAMLLNTWQRFSVRVNAGFEYVRSIKGDHWIVWWEDRAGRVYDAEAASVRSAMRMALKNGWSDQFGRKS